MTERLLSPMTSLIRPPLEEKLTPLVEKKRNYICEGCESLVTAYEACPVCDRK